MLLGNWGKEYRGDFVAGALAFLISSSISWALNGFEDVTTVISMVGVLISITPLVLSVDGIPDYTLRKWRQSKFRYPVRVGILNGYLREVGVGGEPNRPYTDYEPHEWFDELSENEEFEVGWTLATQISREFDVILNPFGEEYPEIDKPNLEALRKIVRFVREGGVFVNVAGLAFYYLWDGQREYLTGPPYETYQLGGQGILQRIVLLRASYLLEAMLYKIFGIRTTLFNAEVLPVRSPEDGYFENLHVVGGVQDVQEFRAPYRSDKDDAKLKPLLISGRQIQEGPMRFHFESYPIAAIGFGRGYLVLCGMKLERKRPQDFRKVLEAVDRVVRKLNEKGTL